MEKWINVDAGPRQVKDLEKAMGRLRGEGQTHTELWGVKGGDERESALMSLMGPVREQVLALDEKIREDHGYRLTRATIRDITAEYVAALPTARESRPVDDKRRSPEQDAELTAQMAARAEKDRAEREARDAMRQQVIAKAPAGAQALIVAELHEDNSDVQTDYFSNTTTRTVAIGWRFGRREDFRQLHAAGRAFAGTAGVTFTERRDNYSMGRGNYLSDHGWDGAGSGWVIKSYSLDNRWITITEDALPERPATAPQGAGMAPASAGGVTVTPSSTGRAGVVEIHFSSRPSPEVLSEVKAHGFRWARGNRCWYGRDVAYAESLATVSASEEAGELASV